MDASIRQLRESLEPFLHALAQHRFRAGVGMEVDAPPRLVAAERPETFHAVREAMEGARSPEEKAHRLRLLEFVASQVEAAVAREADQALREHKARGRVVLDDEVVPFHEAMARVPREPTQLRRQQLDRAIGTFLWEARPLFRRRLDAGQRAAERLGFPNPGAVFAAVSGIEVPKLITDSEQLLRKTEDAYRDVLAYVLHKADAKLSPLPSGGARRADVQAALRGGFPDVFRREDVVPALNRWLGDLGLTPHAEGRIRPDDEERPGRSPRPFVAAVRVPDEVRLAVIPGSGLDASAALLHEMGHAQALAHVSAKLPVEDRRLGDPSIGEAWATLFEHLLTDAHWLKRYLSLPLTVARDVARMAAFNSLYLMRRAAARLRLEDRLEEGGEDEALAETYAETQRAALFVDVDRRFVFLDRDPGRYVTRYLRGWALEARLRPVLEQRFDEDFWRNPGAAAFLKSLWAQGTREDAAQLCTSVTGQELSLELAGQRLVRILGA